MGRDPHVQESMISLELMSAHFKGGSFGKVEPWSNLASTPSLECLRRKLLEESFNWLSTEDEVSFVLASEASIAEK